MKHPAIAVFTEVSGDDIIAAGGSGAWVLNPKNANEQRYLVCCRKVGPEGHSSERHGSAFLIGIIKGLIAVDRNARNQQRYHISISEYATLDMPDIWRAWRNPVRYSSLEELGIDPKRLKFTLVPSGSVHNPQNQMPTRAVRKLTIAEAKQGLAAAFGVRPEDIDITIRAHGAS